MARTTVELPEALENRLQREATRRGMTASEFAVEAIREKLDETAPRKFESAGVGASGHGGISTRIEQELDEIYADRLVDRAAP